MTGEYVVLRGATALALPLRKGQAMEIEFTPGEETLINWTASDIEETWFEAKLTKRETFQILECTDPKIGDRLLQLLNTALEMNPEFLSESGTYSCDCRIMFERHWGWGTSSTLISNLAWWARIDPYEFNRKVGIGSGYDIACARAESAILYRLTGEGPDVEPVDFFPWFHHHLLFVYLGRKADTDDEIRKFKMRGPELGEAVQEISEISEMLYQTRDLEEFIDGIQRHEDIMSELLGKPPVGKTLFPDYKGAVKSLGAWGGDFILAVSTGSEHMNRDYFTGKGYPVHFNWDEIIL
jgi:mevalonate kinase